MKPPRISLFSRLRASFLTGLVVVAPAVLTIWLITNVVEFIDSRVIPLIPPGLIPEAMRGLSIPGLGVVVALVFTLVVGWLARNFIGRALIDWSERLVGRMPVVRSIYNALKQIAETVFAQSSTTFNRSCLVEYPRPGLWAMAFVSTDTKGEVATRLSDRHDDRGKMISVFLPTTPNPTSGFLLFVPEADVIYLDMSVEDAAKLIISAGLVTPEDARLKPASQAPRRQSTKADTSTLD